MTEGMQMLGVSLLLALGIIFCFAFLFSHFVALAQPPKQRAMWTVGAASVIYFGLLISALPLEYLFVGLGPAPIAIFLMQLYWHRFFAKAWYDDPNDIPDGMTRANEDWRVALYALVAVAVVAFVKKAPVIFAIQGAVSR